MCFTDYHNSFVDHRLKYIQTITGVLMLHHRCVQEALVRHNHAVCICGFTFRIILYGFSMWLTYWELVVFVNNSVRPWIWPIDDTRLMDTLEKFCCDGRIWPMVTFDLTAQLEHKSRTQIAKMLSGCPSRDLHRGAQLDGLFDHRLDQRDIVALPLAHLDIRSGDEIRRGGCHN